MHDPEGCPGCEKRAKERYDRYVAAFRAVLRTQDGRDTFDYWIDQSGMFAEKLWCPGAEINAVVARRDVGSAIYKQICLVSPTALTTMMSDRINRAEAELRLIEQEEKSEKKEKK